MKNILNSESFGNLKQMGHAVPRNKNNYIIDHFKVGKEYTVFNEDKTDSFRVRCTQDCPINLKVI